MPQPRPSAAGSSGSSTSFSADAVISTEEITALRALLASDGWAIVRTAMDREIRFVTSQLAGPDPITEAELHWRRGSLFAAERLLQLPERLIALFENDHLINSSAMAEQRTNR